MAFSAHWRSNHFDKRALHSLAEGNAGCNLAIWKVPSRNRHIHHTRATLGSASVKLLPITTNMGIFGGLAVAGAVGIW